MGNYIKYLLTFSLIFFALSTTFCQSDATMKKAMSSKELEVYRIEFRKSLPKKGETINDFEDIFSEYQKSSLDSAINAFKKETGFELTIVTVDSFSVSRENFDDLILFLAKNWGINDRNGNGVIIGFSRDHRINKIARCDKMTKLIDDVELMKITNNEFVEYFKQRKYYEGMRNGIIKLSAILKEKMSKH
jgi:uncharacterized membrane protein YgcG